MKPQTQPPDQGTIPTLGRQLSRYALVGLASNAFLYLAYLSLTGLGLGHKVSMTLVFAAGVLQTYLLNKGWSFSYKEEQRSTFVKYCTVYVTAYLLSLISMWILVDYFGLNHQLVQIFLIFASAMTIFLGLRFWVFD